MAHITPQEILDRNDDLFGEDPYNPLPELLYAMTIALVLLWYFN